VPDLKNKFNIYTGIIKFFWDLISTILGFDQ